MATLEAEHDLLKQTVASQDETTSSRIDDVAAALNNLESTTSQTQTRVANVETLAETLESAVTSATQELADVVTCQIGVAAAVRVIEDDSQHIGNTCNVSKTPSCGPFATFSRGVAVGGGTSLGSTRTIQCDDGLMVSNPKNAIAICQKKTPLSPAAWSVVSSSINCITSPTNKPTASPVSSSPTIAQSWRLVYRQKNCRMAALDDRDISRGDPSADCYAVWKDLENLSQDGVYKFRLRYPQAWKGPATGKVPSIVWTQTNNPTKGYRTTSYTALDTGPVPNWWQSPNGRQGPSFTGLALSVSSAAFLDGQHSYANWWWAVGTRIPSFPGSIGNWGYPTDGAYGYGKCGSTWDACWVELEVFY